MALYYEVRNYLLKPDKHICRLTFNDQPLSRTWRLGKLQYTLDSTKIDQEANQPAQNHFEEEFMSDEYNVFDEFVGGLEQIDYLTDYMNYGISLQLVVFDDEKGKTKIIARKDYTFDDFDNSPEDLFYESIKGEQRESNFVNRGFEVGIRVHKPNEIFDEELKVKQFTYDDWREQEYSEEHSSICNPEEEPQKIMSNNKIHRR